MRMKAGTSPPASPSIDSDNDFARYCWVKEELLEMAKALEGPHRTVQAILSAAGFVVRVVVKHECHELWEARMKTGIFDLSPDLRLASRQIRRLLVLGGIPTGEVIVNRTEEYVRIAFLSPLGVPGVLNGTELTLGLSSATSP